MLPRLQAITLDLDDTLWPYGPIAAGIAAALGEFLTAAAPRAAAAYDEEALRRSLMAPKETRGSSPVHTAWLRPDGLADRLRAAGEDPRLAVEGMEVASAARQRVELYPDAEPAITRLRARYKVAAVTNGTADVIQIGIDSWFDAVITADDAGAGKPDPRIFVAACAALDERPADVLHAGDDLVKDVEGALDAGLRAAWVHRGPDLAGPPAALRVRDMLELATALGA